MRSSLLSNDERQGQGAAIIPSERHLMEFCVDERFTRVRVVFHRHPMRFDWRNWKRRSELRQRDPIES